MKIAKIIYNQSRYRRHQENWLLSKISTIDLKRGDLVIDVGGDPRSHYAQVLKQNLMNLQFWNIEGEGAEFKFVDLNLIEKIPLIPVGTKLLLCINVLPHLKRPAELLEHLIAHMPSGCALLVASPCQFPLHPTPKDYFRLMPDFFVDLVKAYEKSGEGKLVLFYEDLREISAIFTSNLYKSTFLNRLSAFLIELIFAGISKIASIIWGNEYTKSIAKKYTSGVGFTFYKR